MTVVNADGTRTKTSVALLAVREIRDLPAYP